MNAETKDVLKKEIANWAEDRTLEAIEFGLNELKEIYIAKLKYKIDEYQAKANAIDREQKETAFMISNLNEKLKEATA